MPKTPLNTTVVLQLDPTFHLELERLRVALLRRFQREARRLVAKHLRYVPPAKAKKERRA